MPTIFVSAVFDDYFLLIFLHEFTFTLHYVPFTSNDATFTFISTFLSPFILVYLFTSLILRFFIFIFPFIFPFLF
jgi:hypothetical protein